MNGELGGIGEGEIDAMGESVTSLEGGEVSLGEGEGNATRVDLLLAYMNIETVFSIPETTMSLDLPDVFK